MYPIVCISMIPLLIYFNRFIAEISLQELVQTNHHRNSSSRGSSAEESLLYDDDVGKKKKAKKGKKGPSSSSLSTKWLGGGLLGYLAWYLVGLLGRGSLSKGYMYYGPYTIPLPLGLSLSDHNYWVMAPLLSACFARSLSNVMSTQSTRSGTKFRTKPLNSGFMIQALS